MLQTNSLTLQPNYFFSKTVILDSKVLIYQNNETAKNRFSCLQHRNNLRQEIWDKNHGKRIWLSHMKMQKFLLKH